MRDLGGSHLSKVQLRVLRGAPDMPPLGLWVLWNPSMQEEELEVGEVVLTGRASQGFVLPSATSVCYTISLRLNIN